MREGRSEHVLINGLSVLHLISRSVLIVSLVVLYQMGGYDEFEFIPMLFIVMPMTALYSTAFVRFAVKYPYSVAIKSVSKPSFNLNLMIPLFLYLVMILVIQFNPWFKSGLPVRGVLWVLLIAEVFHAVLAATRLAALFELREK